MTDDPPLSPLPATDVRRTSLPVSPLTLVFVAGLTALAALFLYDYLFVRVYLIEEWEWNATRSDWLFGLSVWLLCYLVAAPLARNRVLAARYWRRLRARPGALAGIVYLALFFLAGTVGAALVGQPRINFEHAHQPPVFTSVDASAVKECAGSIANGRCHGTFAHPLGTDYYGYDMFGLILLGTHTALYVAVISAALIVPIGTLIGTIAGYYGDAIDTVLMRYVDIQQTVPAVVVYIVLILIVEKSLFMLVVIFGLFSWGGIARVVRSEVLQRRSAGYVVAAETLGGTRGYVVRRHLLPNVSHAIVMAVAQTIPLLLITEAAVAYLDLGDADLVSWGGIIAAGLSYSLDVFVDRWWVSTGGVLALAGSVVAFKLIGDALRTVLDPREG